MEKHSLPDLQGRIAAGDWQAVALTTVYSFAQYKLL